MGRGCTQSKNRTRRLVFRAGKEGGGLKDLVEEGRGA